MSDYWLQVVNIYRLRSLQVILESVLLETERLSVFSLGFMLTFVTIKYWFCLAVLSLAAHGLAFSFIYATAIGAAQAWFPQNKRGFVGSFVLSGYGFGKAFSLNPARL